MSKENIPSRFASLHSHSGFSTFDGLGYPQEHIDFVRNNGMDAWCLTDHGQMNGFAHAWLHAHNLHNQGINFKFVPGCEMYVHPDLEAWKLDYEIRKAVKKGDKNAIKALSEQMEILNSPLIAKIDGNDETLDLSSDPASLTIENEEETKSTKYYDPIKRRHHLVVLPKTSIGLQRLFNLVSRGYLEGFYRFPRVDYKMLKEAASGGHLMVSTACLGGPLCYEVFKHLQQHGFDELNANLLNDEALMNKIMIDIGNSYDQLIDAVGMNNVKLELQFNKLSAQHLVNRAIMQFAKNENLTNQLVVTVDSHYSQPEHWKEREIYRKLGWLNYKDIDPTQIPQTSDELKCELYPKNADQTWQSYHDTKQDYDFYDDQLICDAIERTYDIVHEEIGDIQPDRSMKLPSCVVPKGKTSMQALIKLCKQGLISRNLSGNKIYIERLKLELKVIEQKKFAEYFLTMKAITDVASDHMLIGPGRGSAAGCLVNYLLYITDVDPIKYDLLFERFLSIHRQEPPDIDSDFADRDLLIELLKEKFGKDNIIPISNYNTFKLKSLVKDISRFYGISYDEVNTATKTVEQDVRKAVTKHGDDKNLFVLKYDDAIKYSKSFKEFIEKYPQVADPIGVLFKQNKALGRHAGGVIFSEKIPERMPIILAKGEAQTPWVEGTNYKHLEEFGWIKFDLLGLETLRIVQRAIELILKRYCDIENPTFGDVKKWFNENMAPGVIDFNDQKVYKYVYHEGRWGGIFQLTSRGAQKLFIKAKPKSIIDIATLTSIYRPGPLAAKVHKLYLTAKADPGSIDYKHPLIKKVTEPTYGTIIFQEQIMQLAEIVAGFPKEECDKVRKAIMKRSISGGEAAKKKASELHEKFVKGAINNGISEDVANDLYNKILYYAGYGFNKSHAISYAIDSYYCAWLMTHYEPEWLCAYMETQAENPKKRANAISEIKALGYDIVNIDIGHATSEWTIMPGKKFMPSFLTVKNVGRSAVDEIKANRPYKTIYNFLWDQDGKWKHSKFNKRAMENLIKIGAFDSFNIIGDDKLFKNYKHMHHVLIDNLNLIKKKKFTIDDFHKLIMETSDIQDWTKQEKIQMHKEVIGHVDLDIVVPKDIQQKFIDKGIQSINDFDEQLAICWFVIDELQIKYTRNNKPYLFLKIYGNTGEKSRMFCWGLRDTDNVKLHENAVCIGKISNGDFGYTTKVWDVKMLC